MSISDDKKMKRGGKNNTLVIVLVLLVLAGFGTAGYVYYQYNNLKNNPDASKQAQQQEVDALKAKVAKLISIPNEETPTIATVTDKEKLKDQPFFKEAQNGDKILIFPQAKKAVIYRESENKLINVGPIAITSDTAAAQPGTEQQSNGNTDKKQ